MTVVLLTGDLMVVSRVQGAAAQAGLGVRTAASSEAAIKFCETDSADVLVVDLATGAVDIAALAGHLKSNETSPLTIIAFGPHVHEERLEAARRAGCDLVVSRGQFFAQIDAILGRCVAG
jgi:CheY-like chemotaxis protein